jgi:hypothetical protein
MPLVDNQSFKDRRKMERLYARAVSFVLLRFPEPIIGQMNDISLLGASILYFQRHEAADETLRLDIFTSDSRFVMKEVPFSTVTDIEIPAEINHGSISLHRRGVEFSFMDKLRRKELKNFIRIYGIGGN